MKRLTLIAVAIFISSSFLAGQKGIIKGQLVDYKTLKPVIDLPIILYGSITGTVTNLEGKFEFTKLPLEITELMVHGGPFNDNSNNYCTLSLRNITLDKDNKIIDLGIIYLFPDNITDVASETPCVILNDNKFKIMLVDGSDRFINGKYGLIDYSNPSAECEN